MNLFREIQSVEMIARAEIDDASRKVFFGLGSYNYISVPNFKRFPIMVFLLVSHKPLCKC